MLHPAPFPLSRVFVACAACTTPTQARSWMLLRRAGGVTERQALYWSEPSAPSLKGLWLVQVHLLGALPHDELVGLMGASN